MKPKPQRFALKKYPVRRCASAALMVVMDFLAVIFAAYLDDRLRDELLPFANGQIFAHALNVPYAYGIVPCLFIISIACAGLYTKRLSFWKCIGKIFNVCLCVNAALFIASCLIVRPGELSRLFLPYFWMFSFINLCVFRCLTQGIISSSPLDE